MPLPTRWERGLKNLAKEEVTSSSVAKTVWKNPLERDSNKLARANIRIKGLGLKVGFSWKF